MAEKEVMTARRAGETRFTVVVPTRERCDTLRSCLRTCVEQTYENLEILVSDNASEDNTREVVGSFKDPRIRYVNPGRRLSMSHNWNFALSHVKEGYVIVIGDDDGVLPGAVQDLDRLTIETGALAVNWPLAFYGWPQSKYEWLRHTLKLPVGRGMRWRDSRKMLAEVMAFRRDFSELPMIYPYMVHTDCIGRATKDGDSFIRSAIPDFYSGIAIAGVLDRYLHSYRPYVLSGISSHSTGASFTNPGKDQRSTNRFSSEDNIPSHPRLAIVPLAVVLTAESFFQAQEAVPALNSVPFDMGIMVKAALREAGKLQSPAYEEAIRSLLEICDKNGLGLRLRRKVERHTPRPWDKLKPHISLSILFEKALFDGRNHGIETVYDASRFAGKVLDEREKGRLFLKERLKFITYQIERGVGPLLKRGREKWGY